MKFSEVVDHASALLQRKGRITYRALKREFHLDDDALADLKFELITGQELAVDKDGEVLVWVGDGEAPPKPTSPPAQSQPPVSYTPPHLADRIRAEQAALEARGSADGERKTITALFADIKGSMALMEDLDPEEARSIVDPVLALMMDAVHRYEGYVAQSTGDGIFAFFGAPLAHEDHPQRALLAALRMQEESRRLAERLRAEKGLPSLQIRVGINTGEVVMRGVRKDDLHTDYTPIGHSTGLASRMEGLATPGSIVVSEHTYKLTEGYFAFKPLGAVRVKGVSEPVSIYEVLGVGPLRTRLQVAARHGLARFVGRHNEIEHLKRAFAQALRSHGQVVGVMGEPGVGKSRLFHEFTLLSRRDCLVLDTFSVSHGKAYPYLPVIDLLKHYFQITLQDDERKRREKVTGKVLSLDRSLEETLPYLFALLDIAEPEAPLQHMDPQLRRRRTIEAIKRLLVRESLNQPLVLVFEDLQWLDGETQAFLLLVGESIASARILLLVNFRPEYRHEWGNKTYYTQLRLDPLGQEDARELLTVLLGDDVALQPLKRFILEKTEGNPFFMEEIVQALVEQGILARDPIGGARLRPGFAFGQVLLPTDLHLPATVQGILTARIDRLSPDDKVLLQTMAVIGKAFPFSLLKQVVSEGEAQMQTQLARLQAAEFIYEQPAFPEPEYTFKHALTQEVAYNSVLLVRRKAWHEQTARAIERLFPERLEAHCGELAHHYSRSGNTEKAIEYLHKAGQQAVHRSANAEAITHVTTALELLKTLPDTPARARQELTLHITLLGVPLLVIQSSSSLEVQAVCARARELCQQLGETRQLFRVLFALRSFHHGRGEFLAARELGERLLDLAQQEQDSALLIEAHRALGSTLFHLGEFPFARAHVEQALTLYDAQHHSPVFLYSREPGVFGLSYAAWLLWHLGYPEQALQRSAQALTLAHQLAYPLSLAPALGFAAMFHQLRRERPLTRERAEAGMALASEQGLPLWVGQATVLRGWALAEQGQSEEGISQIRQGLASQQAIGARLFHPYYLVLLAEVYGKAGLAEEGLAALAEALTVVDNSGERFYEAELYRLKGELTLQKGARDWGLGARSSPPQAPSLKPQVPSGVEREAEECFHKAIDIARKQQAKSLELRATMSLARLWKEQGKRTEAHVMLFEIYSWFTEGFDTKDLQEAKALLEALT